MKRLLSDSGKLGKNGLRSLIVNCAKVIGPLQVTTDMADYLQRLMAGTCDSASVCIPWHLHSQDRPELALLSRQSQAMVGPGNAALWDTKARTIACSCHTSLQEFCHVARQARVGPGVLQTLWDTTACIFTICFACDLLLIQCGKTQVCLSSLAVIDSMWEDDGLGRDIAGASVWPKCSSHAANFRACTYIACQNWVSYFLLLSCFFFFAVRRCLSMADQCAGRELNSKA